MYSATGETALTGFSRFWRHWGLVFAVLVLFAVGAAVAISASDWADTSQMVTDARIPLEELGFSVLLGALAFAGGGGGQNLVQSNRIRDKRFGMGAYVPRITSPVTGEAEAAPSTGYVFEHTERDLRRWRAWWRFANIEQLSTFVLITFISIFFTSLFAYSTVLGGQRLPDDIGFLQVEGEALKDEVGNWLGASSG